MICNGLFSHMPDKSVHQYSSQVRIKLIIPQDYLQSSEMSFPFLMIEKCNHDIRLNYITEITATVVFALRLKFKVALLS